MVWTRGEFGKEAREDENERRSGSGAWSTGLVRVEGGGGERPGGRGRTGRGRERERVCEREGERERASERVLPPRARRPRPPRLFFLKERERVCVCALRRVEGGGGACMDPI